MICSILFWVIMYCFKQNLTYQILSSYSIPSDTLYKTLITLCFHFPPFSLCAIIITYFTSSWAITISCYQQFNNQNIMLMTDVLWIEDYNLQRSTFLGFVLVAFYLCDKIPEINNVQEESLILAYGSRVFSPWSVGSVALGPVVARYNTVGAHVRGGLFTSWQPGSKKGKRKGRGSQYPLQGCALDNLISLHQAPYHKGCTTSQFCHRLGSKSSTHGLLEDIQDQCYIRY